MRGKTPPNTEGSILVSAEILKSAHLGVEELRHHLIELKRLLATRFDLVVPREISDLPTLLWIVGLSQRLQRLKGCDGFDRHVRTYTQDQVQSSYFVTVIASYLLDRVDSIVLEPAVRGTAKKPDILADFRGEQVYLECKRIDTSKFNYSKEHEHMFSILREYIDVPHQISITYKKPFSDAELHGLGRALRERASLVTGDGRIIDNADLEVQVIRRQAYGDRRFSVTMGMILQDTRENCSYPGHAYMKGGITLSLSGPKVNYTKVLRQKIRYSRSQCPRDRPYILLIDGTSLLGELKQNIRALSSAFQPEMNTRFSAAALVTQHPRLDRRDLDLEFYLVSNPFAQFPISKGFELLFHGSRTE